MKNTIKILLLLLIFQSCKEKVEISSINPVDWEIRTIEFNLPDSLPHGTTYLSVYSQIYSQTEHKTHDLTATVSIRNVNKADSVYINKAEYYNTKGNSIRTYFDKPIFIAPMETVEIVIDERDQEGGTGANFLFDWTIKPNSNDPIFEAIMISTSGQQGLSFTTQGKKIN
ncbi:DUF3124 domain-containing protein [Maribacter sp. PR1]|uniref:DUF3124 domain-containing protein n=1 Tax=Maribacter cobaltidurans TaxID=1178778 RepID=A0ABU7IWN1_9FLAO|nr:MULTISPECIES: DUF3124 domain-containing protein [Maribacter]MDC6389905.1 DUF3124 domain-containing protein [Maribacter sp. PR1]MEE1977295.1 DUF3124 domain-containing protein [Maribacter cobaltidurans]|tara:strand:- start:1016 stop:1525 length:510 start_codon:yes stop_codon:yes gene_type:complete